MNLSVSVDGEIWGHVWTSKNMDPMWDVLVTSYTSGAYIPGKKVRYIKIERKLTEPGRLKLNTVKVFGE